MYSVHDFPPFPFSPKKSPSILAPGYVCEGERGRKKKQKKSVHSLCLSLRHDTQPQHNNRQTHARTPQRPKNVEDIKKKKKAKGGKMVHSISLLPRTNKSTTQQQTKTTQNLSVSMFQKKRKENRQLRIFRLLLSFLLSSACRPSSSSSTRLWTAHGPCCQRQSPNRGRRRS